MNKFIVFMSVIALFSSMYVFHRLDHMVITVHPYSAENVARVRANIPLNQPEPEPIIEVDPITVIPPDTLNCMQTNIYFESRNQSAMGMIGTGWVTINRVNHSRWKNDICSVVKDAKVNSRGFPKRHKCQFSWYCDGLKDTPDLHNKQERDAWELSGQIALTMISSCTMGYHMERCPPDPTKGSLFYHSDAVDPEWNYVKTVKIDKHQYYRLAATE